MKFNYYLRRNSLSNEVHQLSVKLRDFTMRARIANMSARHRRMAREKLLTVDPIVGHGVKLDLAGATWGCECNSCYAKRYEYVQQQGNKTKSGMN